MIKINLYCKPSKLKKIKLIAIQAFISTSLIGCTSNNNFDIAQNYEITSSSEIEEVPTITNVPTKTPTITPNIILENNKNSVQLPEKYNLLDKEITINSKDTISLNNLISKETDYKYSSYFEIDENFNKYNKLTKETVNSHNIIIDGFVDSEKLYQQVITNNIEFIKMGVNNNIFKSYTGERIKEICNLITKILNDKISKIDIDLNTLDYNLSNLKIFQFNKYLYATITTDGCLAINENFIKTLNVTNAFEKIITHETMHLIQKGLDSNNTGINYKFDDSTINSLYNQWFIETTAEKCASYYNKEEIIYTNNMKYLDSLIISSAFNNQTIEYINFDNDLKKFYEMINCDGLISNKELATMMYAVNIVSGETTEFEKKYKNQNQIALSYMEMKELTDIYNSTYFQTLTKIFYYNLSKQSLKLNEIFSLISLFEISCSNVTRYSDIYKLDANEYFIENYINIQTCYFEIISKKLNIDINDLFDLYNYYNENENIIISCTKNDNSLNYIYSKIAYKKGDSINQVYNDLYIKNKHK